MSQPRQEEGGNAKDKSSRMTVTVRVRPTKEGEAPAIVETKPPNVVSISKRAKAGAVLQSEMGSLHEYALDEVFGPDCSQEEVYRRTTEDLIPGVLSGINTTVFAYGATGAGKTHTIIGSEEQPGIIQLSLTDLFRLLELKKAAEDAVGTWRVVVSYLEVYNEQVYDLLCGQEEQRALKPCEVGSSGEVAVSGLTEREVSDADAVLTMVKEGNTRRRMESTAANTVSSRSHAVLQVAVVHEEPEEEKAPQTRKRTRRHSVVRLGQKRPVKRTTAKLSLIDLAGSERASATKNRGARLHEGANINKSLLALANCINALARTGKARRVKYRDSKLTLLLKSSLEGKCRVVMIAAVSPSFRSFEESHNTLKYASRAKNIKVKPTANVEVHDPSARRPAAPAVAGSNTAARVAARAERVARREAGEANGHEAARSRAAARVRGRRAAPEMEEEEGDARPLTAHPPCPPGRRHQSRAAHQQYRRVSVSVHNREQLWEGFTPGAGGAPPRPQSAPREAASRLRLPTAGRVASPAVPEGEASVLAAANAYVSTPSSLRDAAAAAGSSLPSSARSSLRPPSAGSRRGLPPVSRGGGRAAAESQRTLEEEIELAWGDTAAPRTGEWTFGTDAVPFTVVESMHDRWASQKARLLRELNAARRNAVEAERDADAVRHRATQAEDRSNQASAKEREASRRLAQVGNERENASRRVNELEQQLEVAHQQLGEVEQSASKWRAAAERARARARRSAIGGGLPVAESGVGASVEVATVEALDGAEAPSRAEDEDEEPEPEPEPVVDASPTKRRRVPGGAQDSSARPASEEEGGDAPASPQNTAPSAEEGGAIGNEWAALCGRSPSAAAERRASCAEEEEEAVSGLDLGDADAGAPGSQPRSFGPTPRPAGSGSRAAVALSNKSDRSHGAGMDPAAAHSEEFDSAAPARRRIEPSAAAAAGSDAEQEPQHGATPGPAGGETIAQRVRRRRSMLQPPSTRAALAHGKGGGLTFDIYEGKPEPTATLKKSAASARPASKSRRVLADNTNATPRASGIPVKRSLRRMSMAAHPPSKGARW